MRLASAKEFLTGQHQMAQTGILKQTVEKGLVEIDIAHKYVDELEAALDKSNKILRWVARHGRLPVGGEQWPNAEVVIDCVKENEDLVYEICPECDGKGWAYYDANEDLVRCDDPAFNEGEYSDDPCHLCGGHKRVKRLGANGKVMP